MDESILILGFFARCASLSFQVTFLFLVKYMRCFFPTIRLHSDAELCWQLSGTRLSFLHRRSARKTVKVWMFKTVYS